MTKRVTIYDVAARAGVSISTVSQVLNRPERVTERTRARVLAAAVEETGYAPTPDAASRARKGSGRIGVVGPFTAYGSYMRRLAGVLEELAPAGIEVCVWDHESATSASPFLSSLPLSRRLDGVILMGLALDDEIADRVARNGLPVVLVDVPLRALESFESSLVNGLNVRADDVYWNAADPVRPDRARHGRRRRLAPGPGHLRPRGLPRPVPPRMAARRAPGLGRRARGDR